MRMLSMFLCATLLVAGESSVTHAKQNSFLSRAAANEQLQRFAKNRKRGSNKQKQQPEEATAEAQQTQSKATSTRTGRSNDPQFQPKPDLNLIYVIDQGNTARILITNQGDFRSTATTVKLHVTPIGPGTQVRREYDLAPLEPGKSKIFNIRGLPLSNVDLFALVDPVNKVKESNENNNIGTHRVEDQISNAADLAVTKFQFFPKEKQVWVTVNNFGQKAVNRTSIHLVANDGTNSRESLFYPVKNLKPGQFQIFRFFPKQMVPGSQFDAQVDLNNDIPEQNEGNNRKLARL